MGGINKLILTARTYCFLLFLFTGKFFAQQDPQYSQYMFNQAVLNPAYIGSKDAINVTGLVRKQWATINGAPQTNNIVFSMPCASNKMALGLLVSQETIGPRKWLSAYVNYAYKIKIGNGKLSLGISPGVMGYQFDRSKLDLYDEEPSLNSNTISNAYNFDMGSGIFYNTRSFYIGLSATHLTSPGLFRHKLPDAASGSLYTLNPHLFRKFLLQRQLRFQRNSTMIFYKVLKKQNPELLQQLLRFAFPQLDLY